MVESRKIEERNQFSLQFIYTWKCHKETPCVAILNKKKSFFSYTNWRAGEQNRSCL
jgi:hypothetical protein